MMRPKGRLIPIRKCRKITKQESAERAKGRVIQKIGKNEYDRLKQNWESMGRSNPQVGHSLVDGMIMSLIQQNLSNREIMVVFNVGNPRINRIRLAIRNPETLKKPKLKPKHAASDIDIQRLKNHLATFDTEDGFPCAHRRPRKFFIQQGLKWKDIWRSYEK